jgi:hypothetical protein
MPSLPEDPAALRALLLSVMAERDSLVAERDALAERNERLQHLLQKLRRMQFGPRSERLPEDQLQFAFEEVEAAIVRGGEKVGHWSGGMMLLRAE